MLTIESRTVLGGTFWVVLMYDEIVYTSFDYQECVMAVDYLNATEGE